MHSDSQSKGWCSFFAFFPETRLEAIPKIRSRSNYGSRRPFDLASVNTLTPLTNRSEVNPCVSRINPLAIPITRPKAGRAVPADRNPITCLKDRNCYLTPLEVVSVTVLWAEVRGAPPIHDKGQDR